MNAVEYQPAADVLDRLKQVDLVAVVGPTSVGKTTMMAMAGERYADLHFVLNNTSRAPRASEREGVDYNFKTRQEMEERIRKGEYVQVAPSLFGDYYATAPEGYSTNGISMLAVLAQAVPIFRSLPFKSVRVIFVIPPSWEEWQRRLKSHSFTLERLKGRLAEAKTSLEFALSENMDFVVSDQTETAADDFAALVLHKPLSERQQSDQSRAQELIKEFLEKLKS